MQYTRPSHTVHPINDILCHCPSDSAFCLVRRIEYVTVYTCSKHHNVGLPL